ncbi:unnamed protein product [Arabidopsis halleri]
MTPDNTGNLTPDSTGKMVTFHHGKKKRTEKLLRRFEAFSRLNLGRSQTWFQD